MEVFRTMSEEKYDFNEWVRNNAEPDEEMDPVEEEYTRKLHILSFYIDKKGINIISQLNGIYVFVDRNYTNAVAAGDTWICSVQLSASNVYYAKPVKKLTLSELMNFDERLRENILNTFWLKHRKELTTLLEPRLRNELQSKLTEDISKQMESEITMLKEENEKLNKLLVETRFQLEKAYEAPVQEGEYILLGSEETVRANVEDSKTITLSSDDSEPHNVPSQPISVQIQTPAVPAIKRATQVPQKYEVERISEDTLFSPSFTE